MEINVEKYSSSITVLITPIFPMLGIVISLVDSRATGSCSHVTLFLDRPLQFFSASQLSFLIESPLHTFLILEQL